MEIVGLDSGFYGCCHRNRDGRHVTADDKTRKLRQAGSKINLESRKRNPKSH